LYILAEISEGKENFGPRELSQLSGTSVIL